VPVNQPLVDLCTKAESGNKLVVEARLKGSGMHWGEDHVNPMLAIRYIICSDRWKEEWPKI